MGNKIITSIVAGIFGASIMCLADGRAFDISFVLQAVVNTSGIFVGIRLADVMLGRGKDEN